MIKHGGPSLAIGVLTGLFLFVRFLPAPVHSSTPTSTPYFPPQTLYPTAAPLPTLPYPEPPTLAPTQTRIPVPSTTHIATLTSWWTYTPGPSPTRYPTNPYQPTFTPWQTVSYPTLPSYPDPWLTVVVTFITTPDGTLAPALTATPWSPGTPGPTTTPYNRTPLPTHDPRTPWPTLTPSQTYVYPDYPFPPVTPDLTEYYPPPGAPAPTEYYPPPYRTPTPTRTAFPSWTFRPTSTPFIRPPTTTRIPTQPCPSPCPYPEPPYPTNPPAPTRAPQGTSQPTTPYPPAPTAERASPEPPQLSPTPVKIQPAPDLSQSLSWTSQAAIDYLAKVKGIPAKSLLLAQEYPVYYPYLKRQFQAVNLLDIRPNGKLFKLLVDLNSGQVIEDVASIDALENIARGARRVNQPPALFARYKALLDLGTVRGAAGRMDEAVRIDPAQTAWRNALEYGLFPALVVLVVLTVLALVQSLMRKR